MCITILGAVTTVLEGTSLLIEEDRSSASLGLGIAVLVCAALSGILGSYIRTKDPSQLAASHQDMSKGYNRIILDIEAEMALDPSERKSGSEYIKWLSSTLQEMSTGGQILPTFIFNSTQRQIDSGELDPAKIWGNDSLTAAVIPPAPPTSPINDNSVNDNAVDNDNAVNDNDNAVIDVDSVFPTMEIRMNDDSINRVASKFQLDRFG